MPIYMQIQGLTGDSKNVNFPGWFSVNNLTWAENRQVTGFSSAAVVPGQLIVAKPLVKGSPSLFLAGAVGNPIGKIVIVESRGTGPAEVISTRLTLTTCTIVNYQMTWEASGTPAEEIAILFDKLEFEDVATKEGAIYNFAGGQVG